MAAYTDESFIESGYGYTGRPSAPATHDPYAYGWEQTTAAPGTDTASPVYRDVEHAPPTLGELLHAKV